MYICSARCWRFKQCDDRKQEERCTFDCTTWHWAKGKIVNQKRNFMLEYYKRKFLYMEVSCRHLVSPHYFPGPLRTPCTIHALGCWLDKGGWEFPPYLQRLFNCKPLFCVYIYRYQNGFLKFIDTNFRSDGQANSFCSKFYSTCLDRLEKIMNLKYSVSFISWDLKFRTSQIISTGPLPCVACSLEYYNTILSSVYCGGKLLPGSYYQLSKTETGSRNPFEIRVYISTLADFLKRYCEWKSCSCFASMKMPMIEYKVDKEIFHLLSTPLWLYHYGSPVCTCSANACDRRRQLYHERWSLHNTYLCKELLY